MAKGDRIKALRKKKGLTQEELAKLLDTQRQTVSKYENGIITNIPSDKVEEMSRILDATPEYILGWDLTAEQKEKPTAADDGLSENVRMLIDFAKSVPEDKAEMVLRVMRSIVESD